MFISKSVSLYTKSTFLLYIIALFILVLDLNLTVNWGENEFKQTAFYLVQFQRPDKSLNIVSSFQNVCLSESF